MTSITGQYSGTAQYQTSSVQESTGFNSRDITGALLEQSTQAEQLSPASVNELQGFYNRTLSDINSIRYDNIPNLKPMKLETADTTENKSRSVSSSPLNPDQSANAVKNAVSTFVNDTGTKVYYDTKWTGNHGGPANISQFLFCDEGCTLTNTPIRSGHEKELYYKIKKHIKSNDITKPENKITPEMIMRWSLEVNSQNGKVCMQDALLTCHNVMRALARPEVSSQNTLKDGDPVKDILKDATSEKGISHYVMDRYKLKDSSVCLGANLFDAGNAYAPFKPCTDSITSSSGSAYHFWVGAFAAMSLDPLTAKAMVHGEGEIIKPLLGNGKSIAKDEMPWGDAGVNATKEMMEGLSFEP